ncbi:MAG TPA: hypothetical protein VFW25_05645 [Silvibacterium sp.]|nr:hypothetical protein [Silvibacterium sp.]
MRTLLTNTQWAEARQKEFAERTNAVLTFWPELKRAFLDLAALEPAKSHVIIAPENDIPHFFVISAGVFDLKLAADLLSDTVFYAYTSSTLKKLIPTESAIYHYGQLRLTRGLWGVVDGPGDEVHQIFADDPQTVAQFPLAARFAQWALDQLLGGYPAITALEESIAVKAEAQEEAARKEAKGGAA